MEEAKEAAINANRKWGAFITHWVVHESQLSEAQKSAASVLADRVERRNERSQGDYARVTCPHCGADRTGSETVDQGRRG